MSDRYLWRSFKTRAISTECSRTRCKTVSNVSLLPVSKYAYDERHLQPVPPSHEKQHWGDVTLRTGRIGSLPAPCPERPERLDNNPNRSLSISTVRSRACIISNLEWSPQLFQRCSLAPAHSFCARRQRCPYGNLVDIVVQIASVHPIFRSMPKGHSVGESGDAENLICRDQSTVGRLSRIADVMVREGKCSDDLGISVDCRSKKDGYDVVFYAY